MAPRIQRTLAEPFAPTSVGLIVVLATLRVAHDNIGDTELAEHLSGDFASVGTVVVDRHVLRTILDTEFVGINDGLDGADVGERRDDQDLALGVVMSCSDSAIAKP